MQPKTVSFDTAKFHVGMKKVAKAVTSTLGPKGRNVFLDDPILPRFTNDGASIANKIILDDKEENAGAWVLRSASGRAADESGDGTTSTCVLAESIFDEARKQNTSMVSIRKSLYDALPEIRQKIKDVSHKTTVKDIKDIALVSAEDTVIAGFIADVFEKKGVEAHVLVEDSATAQSSVEMKDGYEAKVGFMSPWLVTNVQKQTAEYQEVPVLCTHKKIDSITQLLPLYEKLSEKKLSKLVIVCSDMDINALGAIVDNKRRGTFSTLVIRATGDLLDDIASVVGATPIGESTGIDFSDENILSKLGVASSVVSTFGNAPTSGVTTFIGKGNSGRAHAGLLQAQLENVKNDFEKNALKKRIARLRSGVAVLRIGALSEQERGYLRDKADDAVRAVKSALEEGYVEGGGMCLYRIAETLSNPILKVALQAPFKKILENAGEDYGKILKDMPEHKGYDAKECKYVDMIKSGIIDPAKVVRIAVESAVSSIAEFLVTDCLVVDYVKSNEK